LKGRVGVVTYVTGFPLATPDEDREVASDVVDVALCRFSIFPLL